MPDNNKAYNVKVELPDGVDSIVRFSGPDGRLLPQRLTLHELIVQTVSERKFLPEGSAAYEGYLKNQIVNARKLASYKALEQAGDYNPQKISAVLDELGVERLPLHERAEQVMMVTGGPGTGKTSIVEDFANKKPEIYRNAAQINPDHYKNLLAPFDELKEKHGAYSHEESSLIAKKIMARLDERMAAGLPAPHVLMDVASPNAERMAFTKRFGQMTAATGTAPPEVTLQRAYDRGHSKSGEVIDRVIPSSEVLGGAAKASARMPNVFEHKNLDFQMVNTDITDGTRNPIVASWDNNTRRLSVHDPDTFIDFVERQNINTAAKSPEEIYQGMDRSPQKLAENLKSYTDKGVQIDLLKPNGEVAVSISSAKVEIAHTLDSKRGAGFVAEMAEHFGKLGKNGGFVAGVALGTLSGAFTLAAGGTKAQAAQAVYEAAVPYGETQIDIAKGHTRAAARSATIETASNLGSLGGAAAGALTGATIGSVVPVIGTAAGGVVGGIVGGIGGGVAVGKASEYMIDHFEGIKDKAVYVSHETVAKLTAATQEVKGLLGSAWDRLAGTQKPELDMQTAFNKLPSVIKPGMPPEVISLIEVKKSPALFDRQYRELKAHGGLDEVAGYIERHPIQAAPAHSPVTEFSTAPATRTAGLNF